MASLRCTICGISWPYRNNYKRCPACLNKCDPIGNAEPDDTDEAMESLRKHFEFDHFYESRHRPNLSETPAEQERFTLDKWREEHNQKLHAVS